MKLRVLSVGALSLLIAGPALAVGPNCADQIAAIKGTLLDHPDAKASLGAKVDEADRLCKANKEEEAQNMAQQIREQLPEASSTAGQGTSSGSSAPSGASPRRAPGGK